MASVRFLSNVRVVLCSGFGGCSGFIFHSACSGCSGFSVEKLWRRLWENLWGKSGKICGKVNNTKLLVEKRRNKLVFHGIVEKFYYEFSTLVFSVKGGFYTVSTGPTTTTTTFNIEESI